MSINERRSWVEKLMNIWNDWNIKMIIFRCPRTVYIYGGYVTKYMNYKRITVIVIGILFNTLKNYNNFHHIYTFKRKLRHREHIVTIDKVFTDNIYYIRYWYCERVGRRTFWKLYLHFESYNNNNNIIKTIETRGGVGISVCVDYRDSVLSRILPSCYGDGL